MSSNHAPATCGDERHAGLVGTSRWTYIVASPSMRKQIAFGGNRSGEPSPEEYRVPNDPWLAEEQHRSG